MVLLVIGAVIWLLLQVAGSATWWIQHRIEVLLTLTGIACWRWFWFVLQTGRAILFRYCVFPRLRRRAEKAMAQFGPVPELTVLATTYHEQAWITEAVFKSVLEDLSRVKGLVRPPRLVVVTGCDEDDRNIRKIFNACLANLLPGKTQAWPPELTLLRGDTGKRPALGLGLEEIARRNPRGDGVVIILDGDTMLEPGLLNKVLPLFRLEPAVSAATTNETGLVQGPAWFAEWSSLRFGLRHRLMCSVSLSNRLLCLTGRFSVFRASVACNPLFRAQVEKDVIGHWFWGAFEMFSGDDKSTWYWLATRGKRMLYVPDAKVTTFEVVHGSSIRRALANIRRWSGNSLRHNWRAIKLGPGRLGWFPWWCLVDQRLTIVTVLVGPAVTLLAVAAGHYEIAAAYLLWVLSSRCCHAAIACKQSRRLSLCYVPLQVFSDWATACMKLWVLFHPAKQNWFNRGARTLNTTRNLSFYRLRNGFAHYLYAFSCGLLVMGIGVLVGVVPLLRDARLFLARKQNPAVRTPAHAGGPGLKHLTGMIQGSGAGGQKKSPEGVNKADP